MHASVPRQQHHNITRRATTPVPAATTATQLLTPTKYIFKLNTFSTAATQLLTQTDNILAHRVHEQLQKSTLPPRDTPEIMFCLSYKGGGSLPGTPGSSSRTQYLPYPVPRQHATTATATAIAKRQHHQSGSNTKAAATPKRQQHQNGSNIKAAATPKRQQQQYARDMLYLKARRI